MAQSRADRKAGLPSTTLGRRRVTKYDPDVMMQIAEMIADGMTREQISKMPGMPTQQTVRQWLINHPHAQEAMAIAREYSAYTFEDEALDLTRQLAAGFVEDKQIRAVDVALTNLRWLAGKRNPRVFSDKIPPSFAIGVQINTPLDLGHGKAITGVYEVEAQVPQEDGDGKARRGPLPEPEADPKATLLLEEGVSPHPTNSLSPQRNRRKKNE